MRINQNLMAANSSRNLTNTNAMMSKSLEKLSSGLRINRAADDAAGLVVSQNLRAQVTGLKQASRNAQDGISVVQTAEGALNEVHTMLNRMRDLAVQAANTGGNDLAARNAAQSEISQLSTEIDRIASTTKFAQSKLLDGTFGSTPAMKTGFLTSNSVTLTAGNTFTININGLGAVTVSLPALAAGSTGAQAATVITGAISTALAASGTAAINALADDVSMTATVEGSGVALTLSVSGLTAGQTFTMADGTVGALASFGFTAGSTVTPAAGSGGSFQVGANSGDTLSLSVPGVSATGLAINALDVTTDAGSAAAITSLDAAIATVSASRGTLGAIQNRFESMINNLAVTTENLQASESRIRDLDMADEMVKFTKTQVLQQAGTAMLAQANQVPQSILSLLKG
jgi:flagellin